MDNTTSPRYSGFMFEEREKPKAPEITPEMIEAGGRAVRLVLEREYGVYYSLSEIVAEKVLRAALGTDKRSQKPT